MARNPGKGKSKPPPTQHPPQRQHSTETQHTTRGRVSPPAAAAAAERQHSRRWALLAVPLASAAWLLARSLHTSASAAQAAGGRPSVAPTAKDGDCGLTRTVSGAADASFFARTEALVEQSKRFEDARTREWQNGNHVVRFLQYHAFKHDPAYVDALWQLTRQADRWGVTGDGAAPRLALRCLELIEYTASEDHELGFHSDGDTHLTVALMLSDAAEFDGGAFELRRAGCHERHAAQRGDFVAWRGWDDHRVRAVTRGARRVLVAEWRCCSAADDTAPPLYRSEDNHAGFVAALAHDAAAPNLHKDLGSLLRDGRADLRGALAEYEAALKLDTRARRHAYMHRALWLFVGGVKVELQDYHGAAAALKQLLDLGDKAAARQLALQLQALKAELVQRPQQAG